MLWMEDGGTWPRKACRAGAFCASGVEAPLPGALGLYGGTRTRSMSALHGHTGSGKNRCPEPSLLPNAPMSFVPQPVVLASECVSLSFCTLIHWDHITVLYVRSNDPPLA